MRREPWVMASSSFHLTISSNRHVGIIGSSKLQSMHLSNHVWHNVRTKFHENPYINYPVIKCARTDITGEVQVWLRSVRLVMRMRRGPWAMASHHPTSRFQATARFVLPYVVSYKVYVWSDHLWHKIHTKFHENPHRKYQVIRCTQKDTTGKVKLCLVGLDQVRLVMRMRRCPWVMASSSIHLTISRNRHVGITGPSQLQSMRLE
jgi:hypothetical protein